MATAPTWLRRDVPDAQSLAEEEIGDIAITVGAAIGILDAVVGRRSGGPAPGASWQRGRRVARATMR
ncbi:hypothetical protein [Pseudaminobacter sp. NGMCC 1.201702]|uniref:hypothetical protein n=1 Tax=Pseudaminobacter sp. NGMCC 1.201702 TaxID=3391825 RepID=UPI0039EF350D